MALENSGDASMFAEATLPLSLAQYEAMLLEKIKSQIVDRNLSSNFVSFYTFAQANVADLLLSFKISVSLDHSKVISALTQTLSRAPVPREGDLTWKDNVGGVLDLTVFFQRAIVPWCEDIKLEFCFVLAVIFVNKFTHTMYPGPRGFLRHVVFWRYFYFQGLSVRQCLQRAFVKNIPYKCQLVLQSILWSARKNKTWNLFYQKLERLSLKIPTVCLTHKSQRLAETRLFDFRVSLLTTKLVRGNLTLEQYLGTTQEPDFKALYLQVFGALWTLHKTLGGFQHNDLHTRNILVELRRSPPTTIQIGKKMDLRSQRPNGVLLKIIDFEQSSLTGVGAVKNHTFRGPDTYGDIVLFLNSVQYGFGRKVPLRLPPEILAFHRRTLRDARTTPVQDDPRTYRMDKQHNDPDRLKTLFYRETSSPDGIFRDFVIS